MATTTSRGQRNQAADNGRKQGPTWSKKGFPVTVAVFEFASANGQGPPNFSVKLSRTFRRDENSDWENSEYLSGSDLLRAAKLLEAADAFVQSRLEDHYRAQKEDRDQR